MKAVLQYRAGPRLRARLANAQVPGLRIVVVDETDKFAEEMRDADVLLHVLEPITAEAIEAAPRLRLIQKIGVGVNTIDRAAAAAHGVAIANMPGTNSQAVAEHALALMLATLRRVVMLDAATRRGAGWSLAPEKLEQTGEIAGRTVGLVGYGEIPRRLAPVLQALGASILYTARSPRPEAVGTFRTLDQLLEEADIVSLHVPLTEETRGLIGATTLARMKPGAVLVNTARGELVDEAALADALRSGRLAGAGLDVLSGEPVGADHPLFALENLVITPHISWLTPETIARSLGVAFENCRRLAAGEPLLHEVAPPRAGQVG